ncbi:HAD family hydrolase [Amphritea balenae]|uniref:HAD family hydrolase n=1 Tax=Amphritea balenae TaxID=452629 RepID=A0A3P1SVK3_9GAMM|nr:HAD family hydrolase [Amphritea balenae]RRD01219.1 HAD family hydrolase [Amphritea balenae]GGK58922.1 hydrolase [Amphritea balenae]
MHHIMFDIDGTLVQSYQFDEQCYLDAVLEVVEKPLSKNWHLYPNITASGILASHLELHGLQDRFDGMHCRVKELFNERVKHYLTDNPLHEIYGAGKLIRTLQAMDNVNVSFATGGWRDSALLKLNAAGIPTQGIPIASACDSHIRTEIMCIALDRAQVSSDHKVTYIGDGDWDRRACAELGWNFVLIGDKTEHPQQLDHFKDLTRLFNYLG